ncbi:protein singed-like isoform X1 [Macrobrachium nipponense]|uniref:protein singed-like isoform X1 n=2 Tax=Macrobrachium nipponense TaxID=159736 RepID=UPI0030C8AD12
MREYYSMMSRLNAVNGFNGCGEMNGTGAAGSGCWTIGLINAKAKYLTAETFGFKINANGVSLKKKQMWTLEPAEKDLITFKSHLNKYISVDQYGNVTCENEDREVSCMFEVSVTDDEHGRWALRNVSRGYFLGAAGDKLICSAKVPTDAELWTIHLAARPQVNLRSLGRKRYAHLNEEGTEIEVDANVPWGEDTLFTLEFRDHKYAIHTSNNKYLSLDGKLVDACGRGCMFSLEYHHGSLALRDHEGQYLSPIGSRAVLKSRSNTVTKDELFALEDSLPQASFGALLNTRYVSVKQGVDVTANQEEISDHEKFQLEYDGATKRWYVRTMQDKYWTLEAGGGIQANATKPTSNALFNFHWQPDGSVAFQANNGKYIATKKSGHLFANADTPDEESARFYFYLINRPVLVLKCEQGFVGYKTSNSLKMECNKANYETIRVERGEQGQVFFRGQQGGYWHACGDGIMADSEVPEGFFIELREATRMCLKNSSGQYIVTEKNGGFKLGDTDPGHATLWEF